VFIARHQRYDAALVATIHDGLLASGMRPQTLRGKKVVLKPNLVEPARSCPHMTTHPTLILAAAEVFRAWDAQVVVAEGPANVRDTEMVLWQSGLGDSVGETGLRFEDLNYDDVTWVANRSGVSSLDGFYFPKTVLDADLIVSMPKMKTHHWVGVTASMKNLYGVLPGIVYGWPKNVLHHKGIAETVTDINALLPRTVAIVDGIECMEGDGPIMGTPKTMGVVVIGVAPPAVDATVCRLMEIDPFAVGYLQLAHKSLGSISGELIEQVGEDWRPLATRFQMPSNPALNAL